MAEIRRSSESDEPASESVLVTGFPSFTARRLAARVLASDPSARLHLLASGNGADEARSFIDSRPATEAARVRVIEGDVSAMDLGLAGAEIAELASEITTIHHLAGVYATGIDRATARRVNVDGTRGVLAFAREARRLRRLIHWSTAMVSGKRGGVILEEELDEGQAFHDVYEETKLEAEVLVRAAMHALPITVVRPGIIVGDSATGEIDKLDGPYYLMMLIATSAGSRSALAGGGAAPLHLVPIDFVVDAAYRLSVTPRAAGMTFHLTDPNPLPARKVQARIAELSERRLRRGFVPAGLARALLRTPGLDRLARAPRSLLQAFEDRMCLYNCRSTLELLGAAGPVCPSFDRYAENLVHFVRKAETQKQLRAVDETRDPLDR
jgi:thioester reductase-like protein